MVGLIVGLVVVIIMRVRGHDIRWRRAAAVGVIGTVLSFLAHLNQMPLEEFGYPTTDSYASFITRNLLNGVLSALAAGGFLFVLTAGAEPLYREMFPGKGVVWPSLPGPRPPDKALLSWRRPRRHPHRHLHRVPDCVLHRAPRNTAPGRPPMCLTAISSRYPLSLGLCPLRRSPPSTRRAQRRVRPRAPSGKRTRFRNGGPPRAHAPAPAEALGPGWSCPH